MAQKTATRAATARIGRWSRRVRDVAVAVALACVACEWAGLRGLK
jgi:hypothetical protein